MRNAKKTNLFLAVVKMAYTICLTSFIMTQSCASGGKTARTDFELVKADKYFVPPANEVVAILYIPDAIDCNICLGDYKNICYMLALFGDEKEAGKIIGKKLKPMKLIKGRTWLEKIMDGYKIALKDAQEKNVERQGYDFNPNIVFITRNKGYIRGLRLDDNNDVVYDEYMKSALLREYFGEIGLISIRPRKADKYFIPPKDKTVAIFLYSDDRRYGHPVALFGDKKLGGKLLYENRKLWEKLEYEYRGLLARLEWFFRGYDFEPKRVFEGRKWLEKIMDAYEVALKKAKEDKKERIYQRRGSIVFLTQDEGYIRGIDIGENTIGDDDMDSEQLKVYFDELGLTDELLGGKPPKKFEVVMADNYFVPPVDETMAILLCRGLHNTIALFGDKEEAEKLMGRKILSKRVFEGRNWLEKIGNTYRIAIKDAKEKEYYRGRGEGGYIWFITPKRGYIRGIGIDADTVHDNYMESSTLKAYFDELGLTKELLAGEPNKAPQD